MLRTLPAVKIASPRSALLVAAACIAVTWPGRAPAAPDNGEGAAAVRRTYNRFIHRDRRKQVLHERAVRELKAGRTLEGLKLLQYLLDAEEDTFVWTAGETQPSSLRRRVLQTLRDLPDEDLQTYQRLYGPEARQLLQRARETGTDEDYREVVRRFYCTQAGFHALDWLATRWLDRGLAGAALRAWRRLLDDPVHRDRITPMLRVKAALARRLSGREAADLPGRPVDPPLQIGGRRVEAIDELLKEGRLAPDRPPAGEWSTALGDRRRNRITSATSPFLQPRWTAPFSPEPDGLIDRLFDHWEERQRHDLAPPAAARFAVVSRGQVIVRDFESIRGFDLRTGERLWSYRCRSSLSRAADELRDLFGATAVPPSQFRNLFDLEQAYIGNSTLGTLSADGQHVYAVDGMSLMRSGLHRQPAAFGPNRNDDGDTGTAPSNRLVALGLSAAEGGDRGEREPVWWVGGPPDSDRELAGHFFLGPPLPAAGRLYAVTEAERELHLVALRPQDGRLLWSQSLGFANDRPGAGRDRLARAGSPSFDDGILVCPAQVGFLVGVDAVDGSLRWVYNDVEERQVRRGGRRRRSRTTYRFEGHPGFACLPHIHDGRVVHLPRRSDEVHCVDLDTGDRLWTGPRKEAEYVGTVTDDLVLLVGRRYCRGLSLQTGEQQWSVRLGMPSGRGLRTGSRYLVPLADGRIATLDLETGREIGFTLGRLSSGESADSQTDLGRVRPGPKTTSGRPETASRWRPGNLLAAGDAVISVEPRGLTVFPQAGPLLAEVRGRIRAGTASAKDRLLAGELELQLGELKTAKHHLTRALAADLPDGAQRRAKTLLQELLYLQLEAGNEDELAILQRLARISRTPSARGRYLMEATQLQRRRGDLRGLLQSVRELARLDVDHPLPVSGRSTYRVSPSAWAAGLMARVAEDATGAELASAQDQVEAARQAAVQAGTRRALERFLTIYRDWPQADPVRLTLARRCLERGRFQRAELLLLDGRRSDDPATAAEATRLLIDLWSRLGLIHEAAGLLAEMEGRFADVPVGNGRTGREFADRFPETSLTARARRHRQPPSWDLSRVIVSKGSWLRNDAELAELYRNFQRRYTTAEGTLQLFDPASRRSEELAVVDRHAGRQVGRIAVPADEVDPPATTERRAGHLVTLGGPDTMYGLSLLEHHLGKPLWRAASETFGDRDESMKPGPAGPSFCTFQSRNRLMVLDPADGRVLWQRSDLDRRFSGRFTGWSSSLFGDGRALVIFSTDRRSYTVYRTATGEKLFEGRLDVDVHQQRRPLGRYLFYVARTETGPRMRIWDPLTDRVLFDEPVRGRIQTAVISERELAVGVPPDRLLVVDVPAGEISRDYTLPGDALNHVNSLRAFRKHGHDYINVRKNVRNRPREDRNYRKARTVLPEWTVTGDLYAFDRETGARLWKRTLPACAVFRFPHIGVPFLVAASRVRTASSEGRAETTLRVEVIDADTGETLGHKDDLPADRLLQAVYTPQAGRLELMGQQSVVELSFSRALQRIAEDPNPL